MKKIISGLLLAMLTLSACAFSEEIKQVTTETVFYIKAVHTLPENALSKFSIFNPAPASEKQEQFVSFLKSCQPYNENININFFGFDATLNIHSDGRINDKCSYEFSGKINNIPEQVVQASQYPLADYAAYSPKLSCQFTQEQLDIVVDALTESINEFNKYGEKEANVKQNAKYKLVNNEKLLSVFKDRKTCSLTGLTNL